MSNDFELPSKTTRPNVRTRSGTQAAPQVVMEAESPAVSEPEAESKVDTQPEYPQEELLRVFDEIIFSGEYRETYTIRGRVPVTFRNRSAEEMSEIQLTIDTAGYNLISTVESIRSIKNLQYALVGYHGKDLSLMKIEEKAKFINKLPGPIVGTLFMLLSKFDNKINQACREGEANF